MLAIPGTIATAYVRSSQNDQGNETGYAKIGLQADRSTVPTSAELLEEFWDVFRCATGHNARNRLRDPRRTRQRAQSQSIIEVNSRRT